VIEAHLLEGSDLVAVGAAVLPDAGGELAGVRVGVAGIAALRIHLEEREADAVLPRFFTNSTMLAALASSACSWRWQAEQATAACPPWSG
jgi:hypothetical protein